MTIQDVAEVYRFQEGIVSETGFSSMVILALLLK